MSKKTNSFTDQLRQVRPVTRNLIESLMLDIWPHHAAIVDFGIDSQKHYEALYYPVREGEIAPHALDAALGHGEKLTDLTRQASSNPHKDVQFHTSWDVMFGRPRPAPPAGPGSPDTHATSRTEHHAKDPDRELEP
jgi:hypothetical protein